MRTAQKVRAAYALLFANLGAFLQVAVRWSLLVALAAASSSFVMAVELPEGSDMHLALLAPLLLVFILSAAASICVGIVWHRFVILGEPAPRFFPADRDVVGRYFVRASVSAFLPLSFFTLVTWISWGTDETPLQDALSDAGMMLLLAIGARFWLTLPASAVGDRTMTFRASWNATRGHGFALFAGLVACDLPLTIASFAVDQLTGDYEPDSLVSIGALAVTLLLDLARNAVWSVFMSYAYLELVRPNQTQADHFR